MSQVYFEFVIQGRYVKVAAIEASTGIEVSIVGAFGTPQAELERLALKKLDFVKRRSARRAEGSARSDTLT